MHGSLQLAINKKAEENKSRVYALHGSETLGSCLRLQPCSDNAPLLSKSSIQWYRVSSDGNQREIISGIHEFSFTCKSLNSTEAVLINYVVKHTI